MMIWFAEMESHETLDVIMLLNINFLLSYSDSHSMHAFLLKGGVLGETSRRQASRKLCDDPEDCPLLAS